MPDLTWRQVTIAYPGDGREERERQAIAHLSRIFPAAEAAGLVTCWWFMRKGSWRIRYVPAHAGTDPLENLLTDGVNWTRDIYEPETHAFGGPQAMNTAHTLFHHDSRHIVDYLHRSPAHRREHSLILCTALMRAAGLDLNEQGDVWATIAQRRGARLGYGLAGGPHVWEAFTNAVRYLLLGTAVATGDWHSGFVHGGEAIRRLREGGQLTRGLRAMLAEHVIFHWNRIGIAATAQAALANAAKEAIFGPNSGPHGET